MTLLMSTSPSLVLVEASSPVTKRVRAIFQNQAFTIVTTSSLEKHPPRSTVLVVAELPFLNRPRAGGVEKFLSRTPNYRVLALLKSEHDVAPLDRLGVRVHDFAVWPTLPFELLRRARVLLSEPVVSPVAPRAPEVPQPIKNLHDPASGRLDAKRIAEYLDISLTDLASAMDEDYKALHKTPAKKAVQPQLAPIARALQILLQLYGSRKDVLAWLNTAHPQLARRTSMSLILEGKATVVLDMLEAALDGLPT